MTIKDLFKQLDGIFHFDLDVAADLVEHMTPVYLTEFEDGLKASWKRFTCQAGRVWCNPPYDVAKLGLWRDRAEKEGKNGVLVAFHCVGEPSVLAQYVFQNARLIYIPQQQIYDGPSVVGFYGPMTNDQRAKLCELPGTVQGR